MAEGKPAPKDERKPRASAAGQASPGFSDEERAALKARAEELKSGARRGPRASKADGESDVLARIAEMPEADRVLARRLHAFVQASAPGLVAKTWYGMPAYARDGTVICFFQGAYKFKTRYATLGFSDKANLDEGDMWPTYYALKELTADTEARIAALLDRALS